ncbi:hypothetical protein BCR35DRAFT_300959 [Leucosporidium creatinivorum]|uniref:Uncharacterized protein n=1 Tax=Leucosporidium creatinivorum TaxID=106004 RepID=A0A1Y2G027_9BASI|nr:hypothetical protein BCR35DRAFT_300959 [Leucosporidium creatinivorum]
MPPKSKKRAPSPAEPEALADSTAPRRDLLPLDQLWALKIKAEQLIEQGDDEAAVLELLEKITDSADGIIGSFPEDSFDEGMIDEDAVDDGLDDEQRKYLEELGILGRDLGGNFGDLRFLQGFALQERAKLPFAPNPSSKGPKKRKAADINPAIATLDQSMSAWEAALQVVSESEPSPYVLAVLGGLFGSSAARGTLAIRDGDIQQQKELLMNCENYDSLIHGDDLPDVFSYSSWFLSKHGDPFLPYIRSIAALTVAAGSITGHNRAKRTRLVATYNKHLAEHEASLATVKKDELHGNGPKWTFAMAQAVADGLLAEFKLRKQVVDEGKEAGEEFDATEARAIAEKAVQALSRSINLIDDLSDAEKVRAPKGAQYEKLVEVHKGLVSLFDQGDADRAKVEERLKQAQEEQELNNKQEK